MQDILRKKKNWGKWLAVVFLVAIIWMFGIKTPAYSVAIDGNKEFVVEKSEDVSSALNQMRDEEFGKRVSFKLAFVSRNQLLAPEKIVTELKLAFQPRVAAAAIFVNGNPVAYVPDVATAQSILENLKKDNSPLAPGETLVSVGFAEDVQVLDSTVPAAKVLVWNDAWNLINIGTDTPQTYSVQPGDSLWTIARKNNLYVSDIVQSNHIQEDSLLALGQKVFLNTPTPLISVIAKVQGQANEPIPYQTNTTVDSSVNGIQVKTEGKNGEKFVAYTAIKRNGQLETKDVSEEKVLANAVDKVVVKGKATYQVASRGATSSGNLVWPVRGSISQSYGGGHTGLDIAGSTGDAVAAADSGSVTFAGWEGGYGNFVIINHGNGLVTRYAHLSKIYVSVGAWVNQGSTIAARGSTGHSTGPHLHFEVLLNGAFRNPISYLN